jgi:hypothetical protein
MSVARLLAAPGYLRTNKHRRLAATMHRSTMPHRWRPAFPSVFVSRGEALSNPEDFAREPAPGSHHPLVKAPKAKIVADPIGIGVRVGGPYLPLDYCVGAACLAEISASAGLQLAARGTT